LVYGNAAFGVVSAAANTPRQIQFALKLLFDMRQNLVLLFFGMLLALQAGGAEPRFTNVPHPRLFLNAERLERIRKEIRSSQTEMLASLVKQADVIAASHPPAYLSKPDLSGDQQNWEMPVGANMPYLELAFVLTRDAKYLASLQEWIMASCNYPTWGLNAYDGGDLAAGYQLLGLALAYDWLQHDLDAKLLETIRQTLIRRGRQMRKQSDIFYWEKTYLQNHMWVSLAGLTAAAFALMDDPEVGAEVRPWFTHSLEKFRRTEELLGPDGASHEGTTYYSLGIDALLKFWNLAADLSDQKPASSWWKNTGYYRLYMALPRNSWTPANDVVDFADSIRADWVGPDYYLHRLAAINRDGYIEGLARATAPISTCGGFGACWLNLIWFDPGVQTRPENTLPTMRHFADMEIVSSRSGWSGDESLVAFKCGPGLGHTATRLLDYDAGSAHAHPDANHFVVFGNGEWLIRSDNYRFKGTDDHNTLLIDGKGQVGEDEPTFNNRRQASVGSWFRATEQVKAKANPHIVTAQSNAVFDYMVGDATEAYRPAAGLRHFVRQMVFLKPDVLIVADEVETDGSHDIELRFHPQIPATPDGAGGYVSRGAKAVLRVMPFPSAGVEVTSGMMPARQLLPPAIQRGLDKLEIDPHQLYTIDLKTKQNHWRNAVALSWAATGEEPRMVSLESQGETLVFRTADKSVRLKWDGSSPEVAPTK
jgi:hypothetical protein